MMRVLVTFAVDAEFAPWRQMRRFRFVDYQGLRLWRSDGDGVEITVLVTGIGAESAALAMDLMMSVADGDQYFDVCVSSGLAGALAESLSAEQIIAPRGLVVEKKHTEVQSDRLEVDPELRKLAIEFGAKEMDCLFTSNKVLVKAEEKKICSSKAEAVDMESFEIVKEAVAWGARCVVIRAISDSSREELPIDFNRTLSREKQVSVAKVIFQLAKNPLVLPSLLRFAKQSRRAADSLADFLEKYVAEPAGIASLNRAEGVAAK